MAHRRHQVLVAAACAALLLSLLPGVAGATAETPRLRAMPTTGPAAIPDGGPALLTDIVTFYVGLVRPEDQARADWMALTDPGSARYRDFVSAADVTSTYGATDATVAGFTAAARTLGLTAGVDASRVVGTLTGSVAAMNTAFGVLVRTTLNQDDGSQAYFVSAPPTVPAALAPYLREVVVSYSRTYVPEQGAGTMQARGDAVTSSAHRARPRNDGRFGVGCSAARKTGAYSFSQLRTAYGLTGVPGSRGDGARIGIVNAGEVPSARGLRTAARCWGWDSESVTATRVAGYTGGFEPGDEAEADVQVARGLADRAAIALYDVWETPEQWFQGPLLAYADDPAPTVLSLSYGVCESGIAGSFTTAPSAVLFDSLVVRLGLRGIATFVSAGDTGSACGGSLGLSWPGSSPYVVSAGGTRLVLNGSNRRTSEVVWNDRRWLSADDGGGATGGGRSAMYPRPDYQPGAWIGAAARGGPDLSAHASQLPSYAVSYSGNWIQFGGTSAAAPLLAAGFAVLSAREVAKGRPPLGPPHGWLYALRAKDSSALYDVGSGTNAFVAKVRGYRAEPGYDLASGVGAPRFDRLARAVLPPG